MTPTPAAQLRALVARFDAKSQTIIRALRTELRKRLPTALELLYDYGTHVVISYGPTERGIDAIFGVAARVTGVELYFNHGKTLPDPKKLLRGSARMVRYVKIESAKQLKDPDLGALITAAVKRAKMPAAPKSPAKLVVRPTAAAKRASTASKSSAARAKPSAKKRAR